MRQAASAKLKKGKKDLGLIDELKGWYKNWLKPDEPRMQHTPPLGPRRKLTQQIEKDEEEFYNRPRR